MLKFSSLSQRPRHFLNFTGLKVDEFNKLQQSIRVDWQQIKQNKFKTDRIRKIGGGRKSKLPNLEDRLLVFLIYAKLYSSYLLLEYLFNVDESTICRIVQEFLPLLSEKIVINRQGRKITTLDELRKLIPDLDEVLVDATEQRIPRPKKKQVRKKHHSGKKKAFTIKTQILTDKRGLILYASNSSPGRTHDYKYFQKTAVPKWLKKNLDIVAYGDSGYQGVNKDYPDISFKLPTKRSRTKKELNRSEKIMNTKQRRKRVSVEHSFAHLKKYKILADIYRNSKEHYSAIFKSVAFVANLRMLERMA